MPATLFLTAIAMVAFAANSLLARIALNANAIDATSFTAIRLIAGAVALSALLFGSKGGTMAATKRPGSWSSALALLGYALAFSLAYLKLDAATGALILFASVQATMIVTGLWRGERPTVRELAGLVVAFGAFVYLVFPGLSAPDPVGTALMIAAGVAWGCYSLRGRGIIDPLAETAGNFVRAALIAAPIALLPLLRHRVTPMGLGLAVISGALTSGLGYAIWYRALPRLSTTQAATVQLTVPVLAALGAIILLSEPLSARLIASSLFILGGVGFAISARAAPRSPPLPAARTDNR